jgi:hypothetical protein
MLTENLVSLVFVSLVTFGAALEPAFGGVNFCVVREMAKVVENHPDWNLHLKTFVQQMGISV